jgi:hypothetical protein
VHVCILFNFFINDLFHAGLHGELQMYADDTVLVYRHMDIGILYSFMSEDLELLDRWLGLNCLEVNTKKTEYMIFDTKKSLPRVDLNLFLGNDLIKRTFNYNYLGLILDSNLGFTQHIDHLKRKLTPYIFATRRLRPCLTRDALWSIYFAFFMSRTIYLNPIWNCAPQYKINEMKRLQNKMIKAITNLPYLTPTSDLYDRKIWPLGVINDFHTIFFIFKLRHNFVYHNFDLEDTQSVHQYPTRQAGDFYIPTSLTNRGRDNVVNKGLAKFNALPASVKSENSISRFKSLLLDHLFSCL